MLASGAQGPLLWVMGRLETAAAFPGSVWVSRQTKWRCVSACQRRVRVKLTEVIAMTAGLLGQLLSVHCIASMSVHSPDLISSVDGDVPIANVDLSLSFCCSMCAGCLPAMACCRQPEAPYLPKRSRLAGAQACLGLQHAARTRWVMEWQTG